MFYYITGKAVHIGGGIAVIDNGGIGYELTVSERTAGKLRANSSDKARLYTYFHVREDAVELFGFSELEEKRLFELLISVSGVGPKVAISILSTLSPEKLALCIMSDDAKSIASAPGIGVKTAQKIILEIKDKLKKEGFSSSDPSSPVAVADAPSDTDTLREALDALTALGYTRSEALSSLKGVGEGKSVEELIRAGLKNLTRQ